MRTVVLGLVVGSFVGLTLFGGVATTAMADHLCDPEPIGRCGAYDREEAYFCYFVVGGKMVPAIDPYVITLGPKVPGLVSMDGPADGTLYIRKAPYETLVNDPWEAPAPFGSVYQETNTMLGLQNRPTRCGTFVWYAECEPMQWMFSGSTPVDQDRLVY